MGTKQLMSTSVSTADYSMMGGSSAGTRFSSFFVGLILPSDGLLSMTVPASWLALGGRSVGLLCDSGKGGWRQAARADEGQGGSAASYRESTVRPAAKRAPTLSSQYRGVSLMPFHPLRTDHAVATTNPDVPRRHRPTHVPELAHVQM